MAVSFESQVAGGTPVWRAGGARHCDRADEPKTRRSHEGQETGTPRRESQIHTVPPGERAKRASYLIGPLERLVLLVNTMSQYFVNGRIYLVSKELTELPGSHWPKHRNIKRTGTMARRARSDHRTGWQLSQGD
jgi:hypothetical protein